jgi:hypothetical protein
MNRWQSTTIAGKHHPENTRGEGTLRRFGGKARHADQITELKKLGETHRKAR